MRKLLLSIPSFMFFVATFAQPSPLVNDNPNAAQFKFETEVHDFGTIDEGPKISYEFRFTNVGKEPLIITGAKASCGCTIPKWPQEPILPGQSSSVKVEYNTKGRPNSFNKAITITSNSKTKTKVIYIKGTVKKAEVFSAPVKEQQGPVE